MKTIGILGGMSAASTQVYYKLLCGMTRDRVGGLHSPDLLIRSVDFAPIAELQAQGAWSDAGARLNQAARLLRRGGADLIVLATNTMHLLADDIMQDVDLPFIHIADATANPIRAAGLKRPGLMATAFTMEQSFYTDRLFAAVSSGGCVKTPLIF